MRTAALRILCLGLVPVLVVAGTANPRARSETTRPAANAVAASTTDSAASARRVAQAKPLPLSSPYWPRLLRERSSAESAVAAAERSLGSTPDLAAEPVGWTPQVPPARYWHAMAYDSARGVVVLFGGQGQDGDLGDTWEWDGTHWEMRRPAHHPSARERHSLAFDTALGVVILFGGYDGDDLGDTWEWDGTDWAQRTPSSAPPPRHGYGMAYDGARGVVVLFGGRNAAGHLGDTWEWDGLEWMQRSAPDHPSARRWPAMSYDTARQTTVLFGGADDSGNRDDTWEWDGASWVLRDPTSRPSARLEHKMAYDTERGVVVLFGGCCYYDDTWEWNGEDWTERSSAAHPSARDGHAMAYDSARGVAVLFGGWAGPDGLRLDDTWEWNGATWQDRGPSSRPPARQAHAMAYDSARGHVVLFGGDAGGLADDTWESDGTSWVQRSPSSHPPARNAHAMAYDSLRGVVVLFGGWGATGSLDDTWEWDGTDWVERSPANHPSPRFQHAMAYDSAHGVVVLFGGAVGGYGDDTWEWDGTNWEMRTPVTRPPARRLHAMAYDDARGMVLLFGGWNGNRLGDTWEWDGTDWAPVAQAGYPPPRYGHALGYDSARGVAVLFGGAFDSQSYLDDTWEWDGTDWVQCSAASHPAARTAHAMAYDAELAGVLLYGGYYYLDGDHYLDDTWAYASPLPHPTLSPIDNPSDDGDYLIAWNTVAGATVYTLEEDSDPSFPAPILRYQGDQTSFGVMGQDPGEWYYRVRASNDQGGGCWSNVESALVRPAAPVLFPVGNADGDGTFLVDWTDVTGATAYELEEDDSSAFSTPTVRYTGPGSQLTISGQQTGVWYFRVKATKGGVHGPWSNTEWVSVIPAAPTLYPISNPDGDSDYLVDWSEVAGASSYQLQEDDNSGFGSPLTRYQGAGTHFDVTGQRLGQWYYRARAQGSGGTGLWSQTVSVDVLPRRLCLPLVPDRLIWIATPTPTPAPPGCQGDETMTFIPASPALNQTFTIEVRSIRGHTNISLSGPGDPDWEGMSKQGSYYFWRWTVAFSTAGSYTYAFYVNNGAVKCKEATVTVQSATMTPTASPSPTPTPTATQVVPAYGVSLGGETSLQILPGTEAVFDLTLTNTGNVEDTFDVGLSANPPGGWQAKWCDDKGCYDYTAGTLPETVPAGGSIPLQIKLIAPVDAPVGQSVSATMSARSQHDGMAYAEHAATAEVISPY